MITEDGLIDLEHKPTVQDIALVYGEQLRAQHPLNPVQRKALSSIQLCRTSGMGTVALHCDSCGHTEFVYQSCRNRNCPQCQSAQKMLWLHKREQELLNCNYFHVVFTVPDLLNPTFLGSPKEMLSILYKAASQTLLELAESDSFLGATPGIIAVLHTWGQNLSYHPHIHMLVTAGGLRLNGSSLDENARWIPSKKKDFLLPVKVLKAKFRGKFLALFKESETYKTNPNPALLNHCYAKDWVVYCKPPYGNPEEVLRYLGRYTHRIAISNERIVKVEDDNVTFRWRDYADHNKMKVMTLSAVEFLRRFMMHVLPSGFHKIRSFGIFAPRRKGKWLPASRKLTRTPAPGPLKTMTELLRDLLGADYDLCPCCKAGRLSAAVSHGLSPPGGAYCA